jgi:hypothetical protein
MAHIWKQIKDGAGDRWAAAALAGDGCAVACYRDGVELKSPAGVAQLECAAVLILPAGSPGAGSRWTLLAGRGAGVRVNGRPIALGVRALADKDEILVGGRRLFFSTEELARAVPFSGLAKPAFCPRCKQKIESGDLAVCCPACHAWSHQSEKYPCWTYSLTCPLCAQASALDAGYNFDPATL